MVESTENSVEQCLPDISDISEYSEDGESDDDSFEKMSGCFYMPQIKNKSSYEYVEYRIQINQQLRAHREAQENTYNILNALMMIK